MKVEYLYSAMVITVIIGCAQSQSHEDPGGGISLSRENEDLFVFPSMQMGLADFASLIKGSLPKVQVNYRGQPTVVAIEKNNGESDKNAVKKKVKNAEFSVGGAKVTASTWNPDSFDHTVNPNKSRKRKAYENTTPRTTQTSTQSTQIEHQSPTVTPSPKGQEQYASTPMDPMLKKALESSIEYKAFQEMKRKFMSQKSKESVVQDYTPRSLEDNQVTPRSIEPLVVSLPSIKNWYHQSEIEEIIEASKGNGNEHELDDSFGSPEEIFEQERQRFLSLQNELQGKREEQDDHESDDSVSQENDSGENKLSSKRRVVRRRHRFKQSSERDDAEKRIKNDTSKKKRVKTFPNFPSRTIDKSHSTQSPRNEAERKGKGKNSEKRIPREYSVTHQIFRTPSTVGLHHETEITHSTTEKSHPLDAKSYHKITIIHPKEEQKQSDPPPAIYHATPVPKRSPNTESYLPSVITLHTTAKPGKAHLPPESKQKDTVVLNLPKMKPTDIPDGYELIPLEKLTPEYEVVPWSEARQVLNVTIASLGAPKKPPAKNTNVNDLNTGPMSGYSDEDDKSRLPRENPNGNSQSDLYNYSKDALVYSPHQAKEHYHQHLPQPQSGYAIPSPVPPSSEGIYKKSPPSAHNSYSHFSFKPHSGYDLGHGVNQGQREYEKDHKHSIYTNHNRPNNEHVFLSDKPSQSQSPFHSYDEKPEGKYEPHYGEPQSGYVSSTFLPPTNEITETIPYSKIHDQQPGRNPVNPTTKSHQGFYEPQSGYGTIHQRSKEHEKVKKKSYPYLGRGYTFPDPSQVSSLKQRHKHLDHSSHHEGTKTDFKTDPMSGYGNNNEISLSNHAGENSEVVKSLNFERSKIPESAFESVIHFGSDFASPYRLSKEQEQLRFPKYKSITIDSTVSTTRSPFPTKSIDVSIPVTIHTTEKPAHFPPTPFPSASPQKYAQTSKPDEEQELHHKVKEVQPEEYQAPKLIPHNAAKPYGSTTIDPNLSTTSPYPYEHWSSPNELFYKPTPSSYVKIKYSGRDGMSGEKPVKSLSPPPGNYFPKHDYKNHPSTALPDLSIHANFPNDKSPLDYKNIKEHTEKPLKSSQLKVTSPRPTHSYYPPYKSPSPPIPEKPRKLSGFYENDFTTKHTYHGQQALYTPTTPRPAQFLGYSPTTDRSAVKSLPNLSTLGPIRSSTPVPHVKHKQYQLGFPGDIPLKVDHFPSQTPGVPVKKIAFYTSPRPVFIPGGTVKHFPYLPPKYNPPYSSGPHGLSHLLHPNASPAKSDQIKRDLNDIIQSLTEQSNVTRTNISILIPTTPAPKADLESSERSQQNEFGFNSKTSIAPESTSVSPSFSAKGNYAKNTPKPAAPELGDELEIGKTVIIKENGEMSMKKENDEKRTEGANSQPHKSFSNIKKFKNSPKRYDDIRSDFNDDFIFSSSENVYSSTEEKNEDSLKPKRNTGAYNTPSPIRRLTAYADTGNNINIKPDPGQTLKQLTTTLRGLTSTVKGLNATIMQAANKLSPKYDQPAATVAYLQREIEKLSKKIEEMQSQKKEEISKEKVKKMLFEVIEEAHKVSNLRSELFQQGLDTNVFPAFDDSNLSLESEYEYFNDYSDIYNEKTKKSIQEESTPSLISPGEINTHFDEKVQWTTLSDHTNEKKNVDEVYFPSESKLRPPFQAEFSSTSETTESNINEKMRKVTAVIGTSFRVDKEGNVIQESINSPTLNLKSEYERQSVSTTMTPLSHSFTPRVDNSLGGDKKNGNVVSVTESPQVTKSTLSFHPSTRVPPIQYSTGPSSTTEPPYANRGPSLSAGTAGPFWQSRPTNFVSSTSKPVRFPEHHAQDRIDHGEDHKNYFTSYYNTNGDADVPNEAAHGVNIMAELADYTEKKNLLQKENQDDVYIKHPESKSSKEVIMYPSGQLLKGSDPDHPPSSTIGPRLEDALVSSFYRDQMPHFVLAKSRRGESASVGQDNRRSSSGLPGTTVMRKKKINSGGILQGILETARDDLTLVGNVIKLALS